MANLDNFFDKYVHKRYSTFVRVTFVNGVRMAISNNTRTNWHRLLGLTLTDLFTDTGYEVELEIDLSECQQYLDVVVIEAQDDAFLEEAPDGLEDLNQHNLLTYKSHQDVLDPFAIDELLGHFVNYRKQNSPNKGALLPLDTFRLYAVLSLIHI